MCQKIYAKNVNSLKSYSNVIMHLPEYEFYYAI